ncbi:MAG: phage terminase large subunit [Pseudomonadota bacterium]
MVRVEVALPAKLRPVFLGQARYRGSYGGRGSGKTRSFAKMAAVFGYIYGRAGLEGIILCGREYLNSLDESSMEEIKHAIREEPWLAAYYEIGEKFIRSVDGRIRFAFSGLRHNIDSLKSKARILLAWIDEAENVSDVSWKKLIPTVREDGSEIWVTWNPESRRSATHKRFRENPPDDAKIVELNFRDNPWFPSVLEKERLEDLAKRPDDYAHIWEGDFAAYAVGAYYIKELNAAKTEGRIGEQEPFEVLPVHTAWDLGIGDSMAIWVWQAAPGGVLVLDYIEDAGHALPHYAALLKGRGWHDGVDYVPHDARVRELGTGRTRLETLDLLGRKPRLAPIHTVDDGINAVREVLPLCRFHSRCEAGLDALRAYRAEWDDKGETLKPRPVHDWASHGADAFRVLALAYRELRAPKRDEKPKPKPGQMVLGPPEARTSTRITLHGR